ncbi:hypothetical protein HZF05_01460 [Sphingomonas sp. CGMCC 1.13654]|uniref:Uncharacterized protein n=1 Tax=Sphingomonas chungangi TaxID=2683589 RepID=A0A838L2K5_9SPHN|nr:hypothetical protein [Sphingomonas chungangi]MBA2932752.1 hypothetical protein [Sphingomonas chungangi]MVW56374.1 hypothetical protein [Sphingomonas chungangi]
MSDWAACTCNWSACACARAVGLVVGVLGRLVERRGARLGIGGRLFGRDQCDLGIVEAGRLRGGGGGKQQCESQPCTVRPEPVEGRALDETADSTSFDFAQDERMRGALEVHHPSR